MDEKCPICGGTGIIRLDVPITDSRFGKAFYCKCKTEERRRKAMQKLRELSGITDAELEQWTFEKFHLGGCEPAKGQTKAAAQGYMKKAVAFLQEFAENPSGWVVLQGEVGTGKSHLAFAVALHRIERAQPVYVSTAPDMLDVLRDAYNEEDGEFQRRFERIRSCPLLILDDLGSERLSDWAEERIYMLFNYRYQKRLPTLVTTNDHLGTNSKIDKRIISRMMEGSLRDKGFCKIIRFPLTDYRPYKNVEMAI
jgi:DNA replication protein DnaC